MALGDGARWGLESLYKISSPTWGDLIMNDLTTPNAHRITAIDGLFSDAEIRDQREVNPSDHGELRMNNRALYGGNTIVIRGRTEAQDMVTLRTMQRQMKRAVNELMGAEKPLYIYSDPRWRAQNLLTNPNFQNSLVSTNWTTSFTAGGVTNVNAVSAAGWRTQWTNAADATSRTLYWLTNTGAAGFPVVGGYQYSAQVRVTIADAPITANSGWRLALYWYKADGSAASTSNATSSTIVAQNTTGTFDLSFTANAPADAAYGSLRIVVGSITTASDVVDMTILRAIVQPGAAVTSYFDGESVGYSWDGARYLSRSTSMRSAFINVAKNQPLVMDERQDNYDLEREFMLTLRSTNPRFLGQWQESLTLANTGVTVTNGTIRNGGDLPSQLSVRFNGVMGVNPKLENLTSAKTLQTLQSALGTGQYTDFTWDGVRKRITDQTGVARPSRFDPTLASWLEVLPGDNSMRLTTPTNGGVGASVVMSWRDTWM
jgi:hypothetical protein